MVGSPGVCFQTFAVYLLWVAAVPATGVRREDCKDGDDRTAGAD